MAVPEVVVDGVVFPPVARPPGSAGSHFLGGAGPSRCVLGFHSRASLSLVPVVQGRGTTVVGGAEYGMAASG